ncbi:creatine kinase M-type-like [Solea senegalensis]|uniref:Creatine kinase M-type-like n=1 Tax=Solea senegalensis TaxID=28829 RepID=A0AAV6PF30_SOLSE|nr:zgc:172076 [Solea senegalensis]KAG7460554.1 creatine kinase M-type-like [Solea senegalensis]
MWKVKPPVFFPLETKYRAILESLVPPDPMDQFHLNRGSVEAEFPDLCRNFTRMGQILTLDFYRRQFYRCTQSGVVFDDIIRPGLEEPGEWAGPVSVGCVAGDAQSYVLFCDFFDRVIEAHHKHKVTRSTPESDFNYDNLKGGDDLDRSYAVRCEVSVVRGVDDFCFPTHCCRGERRQLLTLARRVFQWFEEAVLPGRLFLLEELNNDQQRELNLSPPSSLQLRTGVTRDWPDARAVWLSKDGRLVVWLNMDDHVRLVTTRDDADVAEAFKCVCINLQKLAVKYGELKHPFTWKQQLGWVSSSPADVGTGLRVSVHLRLKLLPQHTRLQDVLKRLRLHMDRTESSEVYVLSNAATFGPSEVELTQLVVDGVKLLIAMEKRLEEVRDIEELVPAQK